MPRKNEALDLLRSLPEDYVCIDVETTGFKNSDRVIQYGMARMRRGVVLHTYSLLLRPEPWVASAPEAADVHGITEAELRLAPSFSPRVARIITGHLTGGGVVVAHGLAFDRRMLTGELTRHEMPWPDTLMEVCTDQLCRRLGVPGDGSTKLSYVAPHLGVDLGQHHNALDDAISAGKVLWALRRRAETGL